MRVLVAEDDPLIALGLCERLRSLGHEPIGPAANGAHAVELARESLPDLYLFDVEMPLLDGLQAATQLADKGLRRPVVVVTGQVAGAQHVELGHRGSPPPQSLRHGPAGRSDASFGPVPLTPPGAGRSLRAGRNHSGVILHRSPTDFPQANGNDLPR